VDVAGVVIDVDAAGVVFWRRILLISTRVAAPLFGARTKTSERRRSTTSFGVVTVRPPSETRTGTGKKTPGGAGTPVNAKLHCTITIKMEKFDRLTLSRPYRCRP
jgi:hypothetical protein